MVSRTSRPWRGDPDLSRFSRKRVSAAAEQQTRVEPSKFN
jgi:hypothetical protein